LFAQVLAQDSENVAALAGLARSHVGAGNIAQAQRTLDLVPAAKHNDPAYAAAKAAIELAEQASQIGPVAELEARVAADPTDYQARFDLAVALNAKGDREGAIEQLLEIVRHDRKWNDDGARKQLVQFFDAWGPADEATVAGRRRLSSILFA
jgi:putative thioredoxin